jgi:hypothetical protein
MNRRPQREGRSGGAALRVAAVLAALAASAAMLAPQPPPPAAAPAPQAGNGGPIAIVPADANATVTGALQVAAGKTLIAASGSITSGDKTTEVTLPRRGMLRVCASTTVKLAADTSVPAGETPGLMMAIDHGALEADFAAAHNSDILLTPDFRIFISGPGAAEVKVRLGQHGDTCVDNPGANAPYVLVTGVFDGGAYRVQPGQRVMFQHGSLQEVVDQEKEPCGCLPAPQPGSNEFPAAQSAGLAPLTPAPQRPAAPPPPAASAPAPSTAQIPSEPLVYPPTATQAQPPAQVEAQPPPSPPAAQPAPNLPSPRATQRVAQPSPAPPPTQKQDKPGLFKRLGRFFKRIFGAE